MKLFCPESNFYQANVWKENCGDPLLLEEFTTKREAINCIRTFKKSYNRAEKLDCYISHFDENGCSDYSFDV